MKIIPLAEGSFGVRRYAFFVETTDVMVFIDPGASLAPVRIDLSLYPLEVKVMYESWDRIE
jgi:predicted metallo-beta-lactamase superfamily hydrolase